MYAITNVMLAGLYIIIIAKTIDLDENIPFIPKLRKYSTAIFN
tara:strand:- start:27 stop:155 length:129 start_codon:yes stop_codon:yes gene_type:complete